jgi:hypothetical protein
LKSKDAKIAALPDPGLEIGASFGVVPLDLRSAVLGLFELMALATRTGSVLPDHLRTAAGSSALKFLAPGMMKAGADIEGTPEARGDELEFSENLLFR